MEREMREISREGRDQRNVFCLCYRDREERNDRRNSRCASFKTKWRCCAGKPSCGVEVAVCGRNHISPKTNIAKHSVLAEYVLVFGALPKTKSFFPLFSNIY